MDNKERFLAALAAILPGADATVRRDADGCYVARVRLPPGAGELAVYGVIGLGQVHLGTNNYVRLITPEAIFVEVYHASLYATYPQTMEV